MALATGSNSREWISHTVVMDQPHICNGSVTQMFWISHTDVMDQPHRCNANNQLATGRGNSSEWISHTDVLDQPHRCIGSATQMY